MKIKALVDFFIPNQRGFEGGKEYDVTAEVGSMLIERELVEEVEVKQTMKSESAETSSKKHNTKK